MDISKFPKETKIEIINKLLDSLEVYNVAHVMSRSERCNYVALLNGDGDTIGRVLVRNYGRG